MLHHAVNIRPPVLQQRQLRPYSLYPLQLQLYTGNPGFRLQLGNHLTA